MNILRKTLPFLTYLSIYSYYYNINGEIFNIDDEELIRTAKQYGVAPVMILNAMADNPLEEIEMIHYLLENTDLQDMLISNIIALLYRKGYYGVNFSAHYIKPEDRSLYVEFIKKLSTRLRSEGFRTFITLAFNVFELLLNVEYDDLEYEQLEKYVDNITMITYDWGLSYISPAVLAYDTIDNLMKAITSRISPQDINFGISTIGYIWRLPYIEGLTTGQSITYDAAIDLAREHGAQILFDEVSRASYFQYFSDYEYIVRFRDARGIEAILLFMEENRLNSIGIWNVMYFFNQMWLVINSKYYIEKRRKLHGFF